MTDRDTINPIEILKDIEESCRGCAVGLPRKLEASNEWTGIAFQLGRNTLVTSMEEIVEILGFPELSVAPLTRNWVRGIANIRGNLLPVIDINAYLGYELTRVTGKTRVLVIDVNGVNAGFVVDEVLGLKHFLNEEYTEDNPCLEQELQPYLQSGFRRDDQVWGIFSLFSLAETPQFLQVAV